MGRKGEKSFDLKYPRAFPDFTEPEAYTVLGPSLVEYKNSVLHKITKTSNHMNTLLGFLPRALEGPFTGVTLTLHFHELQGKYAWKTTQIGF